MYVASGQRESATNRRRRRTVVEPQGSMWLDISKQSPRSRLMLGGVFFFGYLMRVLR
jgi:hypothetical protein